MGKTLPKNIDLNTGSEKEEPKDDGSFVNSAIIGAVTDSALLGGLLGGDLLGGMVGDILDGDLFD